MLLAFSELRIALVPVLAPKRRLDQHAPEMISRSFAHGITPNGFSESVLRNSQPLLCGHDQTEELVDIGVTIIDQTRSLERLECLIEMSFGVELSSDREVRLKEVAVFIDSLLEQGHPGLAIPLAQLGDALREG
jgi:hypothetical protein